MTVTVDRVKCACSDCVCVVEVSKGIQKEGRIYCSENCADHHKSHEGCDHAGCHCHG